MKKALKTIFPILLLAIFMGCSTEVGPTTPGSSSGPGGVLLGMSRDEVVQAMLAEVQLLQMSGQVTNPYATRYVNNLRDEPLEVMYYYTGMEKPDDRVSAGELVPIILKDGSVVGWGWETLDEMTGSRPVPRFQNVGEGTIEIPGS
jgi:hypothetical protein